MGKLSAVITATPEYDDLAKLDKCLRSLNSFADEIVLVVNGESSLLTSVAHKYKATVYNHKYSNYVEPLRNFGIEKASHDWILILDPDESIPDTLSKKLASMLHDESLNYCLVPRKNVIFGSWLKHSRWWPDFNVRFFRKGKVSWSDEIHLPPITEGRGYELPIKEEYAIVHDNYTTVEDYLARLNRYTSVQAQAKVREGYKFKWQDVLVKPGSEFLSRYFAGFGYKDGLHGLVLAILQAISEFVVYLKVWQDEGFKHSELMPEEFIKLAGKEIKEYQWWSVQTLLKNATLPRKILLKLYRKLFLR